jgi:hypothetical protein
MCVCVCVCVCVCAYNKCNGHHPENMLNGAYNNNNNKQTNKQTPWPLVRERTIPTERPPLVDEI